MGLKRTDEIRKDAVRIALSSGLTTARLSKRSFDERGHSQGGAGHLKKGHGVLREPKAPLTHVNMRCRAVHEV